jgi:hypothetical protein
MMACSPSACENCGWRGRASARFESNEARGVEKCARTRGCRLLRLERGAKLVGPALVARRSRRLDRSGGGTVGRRLHAEFPARDYLLIAVVGSSSPATTSE